MDSKKFIAMLIVGFTVFSFVVSSYAGGAVSESKKVLMGQLSQARVDFMTSRDKLHDQDRLLRIAWHNERDTLYMQAKENPKDKSIKEKLNDGAKKFFADKADIYAQLEQLREDWLKVRKDLSGQIKNTK
ncbi:MAG: hypothetical protein WC412_05025 [Candidatus Omnitrophota bacterium]|jgi:hypothetical protein